jgi:hypothetical protein
MPSRRLHVVNDSPPLLAVCERCNARFKSGSLKAEDAEKEVKAAFDAHECESDEGSGTPR